MSPLCENCLLVLTGAIQLLGIVSLVYARMSERSGGSMRCYCIFFTSMLAMVATTILSLCCLDCWLTSGVVLSLMAVGATLDFRPTCLATV